MTEPNDPNAVELPPCPCRDCAGRIAMDPHATPDEEPVCTVCGYCEDENDHRVNDCWACGAFSFIINQSNIICSGCGIELTGPDEETAIAAWNLRTPVAGKASELADEAVDELIGHLLVHQCGCGGECGMRTPPYIKEAAKALGRLKLENAALRRPPAITEEAVEALRKAAQWFRDYESQHRAKRTDEGNLKAGTNEERALYLERIVAALSASPVATPGADREAVLEEALELLRQAMNALGTVDKNDPLERIADNGMTVWDAMQSENWRLWPKYRALLATIRSLKSDPVAGDGGEAMDHGNVGWGGEAGRGCI
jgi:hypothetical protein